jgi:hypothetical protein
MGKGGAGGRGRGLRIKDEGVFTAAALGAAPAVEFGQGTSAPVRAAVAQAARAAAGRGTPERLARAAALRQRQVGERVSSPAIRRAFAKLYGPGKEFHRGVSPGNLVESSGLKFSTVARTLKRWQKRGAVEFDYLSSHEAGAARQYSKHVLEHDGKVVHAFRIFRPDRLN